MTNTIRKPYRGYVFEMNTLLADSQFDQLITCFQTPSGPSGKALGGRRQMPSLELDRKGPVVVKSYRRGGLPGRIIRRHYLKRGPIRGAEELEWLKRVRLLGVKAPEPVVAAHKGILVYRCWLVTREVTGAIALAQLSLDHPEALGAIGPICTRQIDILIANRIFHPDLHPGNVLVDPEGQIWIIDFDKAGYYRGRRQHLADRYRQRWRRAVRKHGLPTALAAMTNPL